MKRTRQILLVEDSDTHAALIRNVLKQLQVAADRVSDAREAVAYLRKEPPYAGRPLPDLILLDLGLPGTCGQELLREIKSDPKWLHIVIVVLTVSLDRRDIEAAYRSYANSYLVKPFDFRELQQMLTSLVAYWLRWNEYPV